MSTDQHKHTAAGLFCQRCGTPAAAGARFCRVCGLALHAPMSAAAAPAALPPGTLTASTWSASATVAGRKWAMVAAVVGVLLLAAGGLWGVQRFAYSPTDPVRDYFAALARRDGPAAARLAHLASSPLLRPGALKTGYQPPTDVRLGAVSHGEPDKETKRPDRSSSWVEVSFRLGTDPTRHRVAIRLSRAESGGLLRGWVIEDGAAGALQVNSRHLAQVRAAAATVATVDAGTVDTDRAVVAPPGRYTVAALSNDPLFSSVQVSADVLGGTGAAVTSLSPAPVVKESVTTAVDQQIRAKVDECATQTVLRPDGCPFGASGVYVYPDPVARWSITTYPTITLGPDDDPSVDGGPVAVDTVQPGKAEVTYTDAGGQSVTLAVEFDAGGVVTVKGGRPVWSG